MDEVISRPAPAAEDEREIRALAAAWSRALENRGVAGLTAAYAPDVLLYDVKPPFRNRGVEAIRSLWEACLPCFPAAFRSTHRDLEVTVGGDAAFAHGLHRVEPIGAPHPAGASWIRVTTCYRRIGGRWRVVHEHVSIPFDPATGQVAPITDPDREA